MNSLWKTDIPSSTLRVIAAVALLSLNYFPIFPTNFLIITVATFILSLVILTWDIYEWKTLNKENGHRVS